MSAANFAKLSRTGVENFIQTVLVIDNELSLDGPPASLPDGIAVVEPLASLKASTRPVEPVPLAPPVPAAADDGDRKSPLDAKQIMDAFLKRSMICGMHKPTGGQTLVDEAIRAARRSDAVIIDWLLEKSDANPAMEIIAGIMKGDADERGRLRLIVIYTSEQDIADIAGKVHNHLGAGSLETPEAGVLTSRDTRIVVLNKDASVGGTRKVAVDQLPDRIVEEFTHLAKGILATFAVTGIAVVRRATHHVLSMFSSELDGAFLGHMCALSSTEDAREFALDLLASELRSVVSMSSDAGRTLASENVELWIDSLGDTEGKLIMGEVGVPVALARKFPTVGLQGVRDSLASQRKTIEPFNVPSKKEGVTPINVGHLFHRGKSGAYEGHLRFSRFATFKTEPFERTALPPDWRPALTLGTLMVARRKDGSIDHEGYLFCTQPRCDAVRLKNPRMFPFQLGVVRTEAPFNVVAAVPGNEGKPVPVTLLIGPKPHDTRMILFAPNHDKKVLASKNDKDLFEFEDSDKNRYLWLGDMRDLTAQRTASMVAAGINNVGLDEYEWLRQISEIKLEDKTK